jgi:hypothetical protein
MFICLNKNSLKSESLKKSFFYETEFICLAYLFSIQGMRWRLIRSTSIDKMDRKAVRSPPLQTCRRLLRFGAIIFPFLSKAQPTCTQWRFVDFWEQKVVKTIDSYFYLYLEVLRNNHIEIRIKNNEKSSVKGGVVWTVKVINN